VGSGGVVILDMTRMVLTAAVEQQQQWHAISQKIFQPWVLKLLQGNHDVAPQQQTPHPSYKAVSRLAVSTTIRRCCDDRSAEHVSTPCSRIQNVHVRMKNWIQGLGGFMNCLAGASAARHLEMSEILRCDSSLLTKIELECKEQEHPTRHRPLPFATARARTMECYITNSSFAADRELTYANGKLNLSFIALR
jgi:hypothetical protein